MKTPLFCLFWLLIFSSCATEKKASKDDQLITDFETAAKDQLFDKWYPLAVDREDGGFFSEITYDFKVGEEQDKMIVTQARHIWANAIAAETYGQKQQYLENARHGFGFLRDKMWDSKNGGFYNFVTKKGVPILDRGQVKTAYGNAFAIYGLAEYYRASKDEAALELAKKTFQWLEENAHDPAYKGYFNILSNDNEIVERTAATASTSDIGYKDQNSSIHLLEAFSTLYEVWPDELLRERLQELLFLVRDTITTDKGHMNLFFEKDWRPVSFRDSTREEIKKHYYLDHVSFGHDVETAYLMLEASEALGIQNDTLTLQKGKKMVDHALKNGWDKETGGFYDGGYYFKGASEIEIVNTEKNWWSQAEGLNSLLLMSRYFPKDKMKYREHFDKLWSYTKTYLMDDGYGGWYEWGLDETPSAKDDPKGHIWKAAYHNFRALRNVVGQLKSSESGI